MHERLQIPINEKMQEGIRICTECHDICLRTAIRCQRSGLYKTQDLRLMNDCAEICQTTANFMLRGSDMYSYICAACSEICDICAMTCAQFTDDYDMQRCADSCRKCFTVCHELTGAKV